MTKGSRSMSREIQRRMAERTGAMLQGLLDDAPVLGLSVDRASNGATIVDCGVRAVGSWEAGRRLAVLAHGALMSARLGWTEVDGIPLPEFVGESWLPLHSAYHLQLSFALEEVDPSIRISGPVRGLTDQRIEIDSPKRVGAWGTAIVETVEIPSVETVEAIARRAAIPPGDLTLLVVPTNSLAGAAQIAGRLNESVLYTLDEGLGVDPSCVVSILGAVPVAPVATVTPPTVTQDDMIHYAGRAVLVVDLPRGCDLDSIAAGLAFASSPAYGRLFSVLLAEAGGVFERIPGLEDLNKVACVTVSDRATGRISTAGQVDGAFLAAALQERKDGPDA